MGLTKAISAIIVADASTKPGLKKSTLTPTRLRIARRWRTLRAPYNGGAVRNGNLMSFRDIKLPTVARSGSRGYPDKAIGGALI